MRTSPRMGGRAFAFATCAVLAVLGAERVAGAAPPSKDECIESHSRGQDYREKGQLSDAKRLFLICAQQSCPALIQSDCAKFGEDLSRIVPSVSFSARDAKGNDLPDTQVFVDGQLVAQRLDDGKAHDVDPGKHTVRFLRNGKDAIVSVVIAVGEKGRNITATIDTGVASGASGGVTAGAGNPPGRDEGAGGMSRPVFPLVVAGIGGAALITGGVLALVGIGGVPDQCSRSSHECAAPPGDPVFSDAKSSINLANIGLGVGIAGAVLGVGGLVWYFTSSPTSDGPSAASPFTSPPATKSATATRILRSITPTTNFHDAAGASARVSF